MGVYETKDSYTGCVTTFAYTPQIQTLTPTPKHILHTNKKKTSNPGGDKEQNDKWELTQGDNINILNLTNHQGNDEVRP